MVGNEWVDFSMCLGGGWWALGNDVVAGWFGFGFGWWVVEREGQRARKRQVVEDGREDRESWVIQFYCFVCIILMCCMLIFFLKKKWEVRWVVNWYVKTFASIHGKIHVYFSIRTYFFYFIQSYFKTTHINLSIIHSILFK